MQKSPLIFLLACAAAFCPMTAFGQQVRDSYKIGTNRYLNTFQEMGYVFSGNTKYFITDSTVLAAQYAIDDRYVDTLKVMGKFVYKKKTYKVTGLKEEAFYQCQNVHNVILPDTMTEIAAAAFRECSALTSVKLPAECNVIGPSGFRRTGLHSFVGPEGLKRIGGMAFFECHRLEYVELPSSLEYIGASAFSRCDDLRTVRVHFSSPVEIDEKCFFYTTPVHKIKLIVPKGCISIFENDPQWGNFSPIVEEGEEQ